jgi:hypothetical protein
MIKNLIRIRRRVFTPQSGNKQKAVPTSGGTAFFVMDPEETLPERPRWASSFQALDFFSSDFASFAFMAIFSSISVVTDLGRSMG